MYLIDRNSPLKTAKDYSLILEGGKKSDLIRIANGKLSLSVDNTMAKDDIREIIMNALADMKISQPVRAFKVFEKISKTNLSLYNNNLNRNNLGGNNLGNNLGNNNLGGNNLGTNNIGGNNLGNNLGGNNLRNNTENNSNFVPGKPKIKAPPARINGNSNGNLNILSNFVSTPKISLNNSKNSNVKPKKNFKKLFKRIQVLKDKIGVFEKKVLENSNSLAGLRREYMSLGGLSNSSLSKNELKRRINSLKKPRKLVSGEYSTPTPVNLFTYASPNSGGSMVTERVNMKNITESVSS
jgi:hypothetical protein